MGARDLIETLAKAGMSVHAADGQLVVQPASKLTDIHRARLREHKPALMALLSEPPQQDAAAGDWQWWRATLADGSTVDIVADGPPQTFPRAGLQIDSVRRHPWPSYPPAPSSDSTTRRGVLAWLRAIGEDDQVAIQQVVDACAADPEARRFYSELAADHIREITRGGEFGRQDTRTGGSFPAGMG